MLDKLPPPGSTIQVGLGMVQVLASVVILFVLLQSLRGSAHAADVMTLALNAALQTDGVFRINNPAREGGFHGKVASRGGKCLAARESLAPNFFNRACFQS